MTKLVQIPVFDLQGTPLDSWKIEGATFGKANSTLLAQAIRVYGSNSHQKTSKVKTRGEVDGSTRKIYRQKGTGNARHGAKYAPIFVGGGIAHGPTGILKLLSSATNHPKNSVLVVTEGRATSLYQSLQNLQGVTMKRSSLVNAYDLVSSDHLVLTKKALDSLLTRISL